MTDSSKDIDELNITNPIIYGLTYYYLEYKKLDITIGEAEEMAKATVKALIAKENIKARIDELEQLDTSRHYGKDYQESMDALDDQKEARLFELRLKLKLNQQKGDE